MPVEIRVWPRETGAEYLIDRTGRTAERAAAEALSQALGGLPLAHEQAAAYCERLEISCAEYQKRFQAAALKLLDDKKSAPVDYHPDCGAEHKEGSAGVPPPASFAAQGPKGGTPALPIA